MQSQNPDITLASMPILTNPARPSSFQQVETVVHVELSPNDLTHLLAWRLCAAAPKAGALAHAARMNCRTEIVVQP